MSLFICSKCGCVENTNLCNVDKNPTQYNVNIEDESKFYPNLSLFDMHGNSDPDEAVWVNGKIWKHYDQIMPLCSECNTGTWHGQFTKYQASKEEKEVAQYSKYNMITPFDHDEGCLTETSQGSGDYVVLQSYEALHKIFRDNFIKQHHDYMSDYDKGYFHLAYKVFKEDPMNFRPYNNGEGVDWNDKRSVSLWILDSILDEGDSTSTTLKEEIGVNNFGINMEQAMKMFEKQIKGNGKKNQTPEERERKLLAAQAKRDRKANRKK